MRQDIRSIIAYLLTALIIMTSGTMAVARGHAMVSGQIVICTGYGPKLITVDADNQPVGPVQYCPDCALSFMAHASIATVHVQCPSAAMKLFFYGPVGSGQCQGFDVAQHARGPPISV